MPQLASKVVDHGRAMVEVHSRYDVAAGDRAIELRHLCHRYCGVLEVNQYQTHFSWMISIRRFYDLFLGGYSNTEENIRLCTS